ncbi:uracil-DNA glycosylase [Proteiniclasticum sp. C24MP]|uniref:uracil-DNA glycosylase n=1 Tax=Proteiniclasticum sp. C24MP TaxID=3374101 RepID=UPI003754C09A
MNDEMEKSWETVLREEKEQPYFRKLMKDLDQAYANETIYPEKHEIFQAFRLTPFDRVKVVILGQDPYHGKGQAEGLAFSVKKGVKIPPSLRNIFKELEEDLHIEKPDHGSLVSWAKEGVLLLNTVLTVKEAEANSHAAMGWKNFTYAVIKKLGQRKEPIVFILWGNQAKEKEKFIADHHRIISTVHPSPLSARRGFFGSKPFSRANRYLQEMGRSPVNWKIE